MPLHLSSKSPKMLRYNGLRGNIHLSWTLVAVLSSLMLASADPPPCDLISKYTDNNGQWFLDNICNGAGFVGDCLFYTKGLTPTARDYADTSGQVTVWDIWSTIQYDNGPNSPLRCILDEDTGTPRTYFTAMCTAYARLCDYYVQVMAPIPSIPGFDDDESFWVTVELPTIQEAVGPGKILLIDGIDKQGGGRTAVYNRATGKRNLIERMAESMTLQYNATDGEVSRLRTHRLHARAGSKNGCGATMDMSSHYDDCLGGSLPW